MNSPDYGFTNSLVSMEESLKTNQISLPIKNSKLTIDQTLTGKWNTAYPTYAKAAIQRRENLARSADELRGQLEEAKGVLAEAFDELKKVELLDERDQARERAEEAAREQAEMDNIGLLRSRMGAVA